MPEKLLSIKEVAEYLKISEEEVKRLVDIGEIPAYKIGDTFLRFRKEQIDAIKIEISEFEKNDKEHVQVAPADRGVSGQPPAGVESGARRNASLASQYDYTFAERVRDFLYFNDFYILSFIIIGVLLYLIFKT